MTIPQARRPRRAWWILLLLGALILAGAAALAFSPGFRLAPPAAFGEELTVDLSEGDHAIYVTPSDQWSEIECTGTFPGGGVLQLRPDMTQQGLLIPEAWDAQGSFSVGTPSPGTITCDGPVADGRFTVGPVMTFFTVIGAVLLAIPGILLVIAGAIVGAVQARRP
ncbi:disulfide bond formation protein DsbB [Microbacterium phyllosphaerae]|uniref:Disulfide bond formation protein DsbB n=1 Tax=Microbacterium phyllosphaerae TaxID=124798 RepID=A0ABS4WMD7_9MICO|nr:hypothetical protein [Microbacterium phyllosphaerae]MBP2377374.1 disulfide bond formation protein DsbB [Microbacterium phyllosphaerae]